MSRTKSGADGKINTNKASVRVHIRIAPQTDKMISFLCKHWGVRTKTAVILRALHESYKREQTQISIEKENQ